MIIWLTILIIGLALILGTEGLIFWGIGAFVTWAFGMSFVWTYWHGLVVAIIVTILKNIFGKD